MGKLRWWWWGARRVGKTTVGNWGGNLLIRCLLVFLKPGDQAQHQIKWVWSCVPVVPALLSWR